MPLCLINGYECCAPYLWWCRFLGKALTVEEIQKLFCVPPSADLCRLISHTLSWLSSSSAHNTPSWGVLWGGSAPESWQAAWVHHYTRSAACLASFKMSDLNFILLLKPKLLKQHYTVDLTQNDSLISFIHGLIREKSIPAIVTARLAGLV